MKLDRLLPDQITFWESSPDGYGGLAFAAPVVTSGRWVFKRSLVKSEDGGDVVSNGVVYTLDEVTVGAYVVQGSTAETDPYTTAAREVITVEAARDVAGAIQFYRARVT